MTTTAPLPFTELDLHRLPAPLSSALSNLVQEQRQSGLTTTADETCDAIEAWFKTVGGLLLADYLASGAPNGSLNRYVFAALESKRGLFVGQWVAMGRGCLDSLRAHWAQGHEPTWPGLANLDFGSPGEPEHPVSRLVQYRNSFGHGAFAQVSDRILEQCRLLEGQVRILAADLMQRPVRFVLPDGGIAVLQSAESGETARGLADAQALADMPAYTPYVEMDDGSVHILGPGLQILKSGDDWELSPGTLGATAEGEGVLQRFQAALERYRREQVGHVHFEPESVPTDPDPAELGFPAFDAALAQHHPLTLIEYRPGTGQYRLAARLLSVMSKILPMVRCWRILNEHPGGSPVVFARALLRLAEDILNLNEGDLEPADKALLDALSKAGQALKAAGQNAGMIVMDADQGQSSGEQLFLVTDVFKAVSGNDSGYRLCLLAQPDPGTALPHDGDVLMAPVPAAEELESSELESALTRWMTDNGELGDPVLKWIVQGQGAQARPLAEIVEHLEQETGMAIFTPALEYAFWSSAPFTERTGDHGSLSIRSAGDFQGPYAQALTQLVSA
jgi:hypothetical protein